MALRTSRRGFLGMLGIGAAAAAVAPIMPKAAADTVAVYSPDGHVHLRSAGQLAEGPRFIAIDCGGTTRFIPVY
jgi:hypothetical protein